MESHILELERENDELERENDFLRTRNADLESDNGRLREALANLIQTINDGEHCFEIVNGEAIDSYMGNAVYPDCEEVEEAKQALSQSAGDRYEKMEAVIGLAKEARNRYVDFTAATEPGSEAWRYKYLDDAMANLRQALADLEGGGGGE